MSTGDKNRFVHVGPYRSDSRSIAACLGVGPDRPATPRACLETAVGRAVTDEDFARFAVDYPAPAERSKK